MSVSIRPARTHDVAEIRRLVDVYASKRILLDKATVTLYEDVQEFLVAETDETGLVGCGALHVMWEDLGELRNAKRTDGHHKTMQYSLSETPIRLLNFLQYSLVSLVQRFR